MVGIRFHLGIRSFIVLPLWVAACTGSIETFGPPAAGEPDPSGQLPGDGVPEKKPGPGSTPTMSSMPPTSMPAASSCTGVQAAPAPVRRLTRVEYNNTVRDLFTDTTLHPADDFQPDGTTAFFDSNTDVGVTAPIAQDYLDVAESMAAQAITHLDTLLPCKPAAAAEEAACARQFVTAFGKRAFRRPLRDAEVGRLMKVYTSARTTGGHAFADAIRLVVTALLQSASFVNHVEGGMTAAGGSGPVALTPYEVASRLSYFLWRTMPDDALIRAADTGKLATAADVEAQARRLLMDARARAGLRAFFTQWLDLPKLDAIQKSSTLFPVFTAALGPALRRETESFVDNILWDGDGRLGTLLTAPFSFINGPVAKVYGASNVQGDDFRRVDLDPAQRGGLLSQPAFLAVQAHPDQTSPVHRGKFVRERLFCQRMPSPPPDVDTTAPPPDPTQTTRQRYAAHLENSFCAGCHRLMNPIGLAFEKYDAVGQYRVSEGGQSIDASGEILSTDDSNGKFDGVLDLSARLARSKQVAGCVSAEWLAYSIGSFDPGDAACLSEKLGTDFAAGAGNIRDLVLAVVKSDAFRFRPAAPVEACK